MSQGWGTGLGHRHRAPEELASSRPVLASVQCVDESKQPMMDMRKVECKVWLEDYNECLHRQKQVRLPSARSHPPAPPAALTHTHASALVREGGSRGRHRPHGAPLASSCIIMHASCTLAWAMP